MRCIVEIAFSEKFAFLHQFFVDEEIIGSKAFFEDLKACVDGYLSPSELALSFWLVTPKDISLYEAKLKIRYVLDKILSTE